MANSLKKAMTDFLRPDDQLRTLRPLVPTETPADAATDTVGDFLHATLRPVLKLQNDLLLAAVADFVRDHHIPLATADATTQQRLLAELLGRNTKLRYTVIGLVTALFTAAEYAYYRTQRPELNRRLLALAQQRVLGQAAAVGVLAVA